MKKIVLFLLLFALGGCTSFGRGVAEAFLDKEKEENVKNCEIHGSEFQGIDYALNRGETVKILMIHGVGSHIPGYSTRLRENLAKHLGLNVFSKHPKNITLINPKDKKTPIGNLRAIKMSSEDHQKNVIFYELTWSEITDKAKKILSYDISGEYKHKRAAFNNAMKAFLDDTIPDPMIYLLDSEGMILNSTKQATCWVIGKRWDELEETQAKVCDVSSIKQIDDMNKENIVFITHSLGSRILLDSISDVVQEVSQAELKTKQAQLIVDELKNKKFTIFMMANQIPLLQIGKKRPPVHNKISSYCKPKGKFYNKRVFSKVDIIAFSDPNDLLSYSIPQSFVDDYMDSRMCPNLTNISVNVADEISAFGVGVVNPMTAHTGYDNDETVIQLMSYGLSSCSEKDLRMRCRFIRLE